MELRFTSEIEDLDTKVWGSGLRVPVSILQHLKDLGWKRLLCTFEGKVEKDTSLMAFKGHRYIILNKQILQQTGKAIGDSLEVLIREEKSDYGTPMPEAMRSALALDEEASTHFHKLTPGKQRNLIYIVQQVKSTELQIKKALIINEHLKETGGQVDFKGLYSMLKQG